MEPVYTVGIFASLCSLSRNIKPVSRTYTVSGIASLRSLLGNFAYDATSFADSTSFFAQGTAIEPYYHAVVFSVRWYYIWCALTSYLRISTLKSLRPVRIRPNSTRKVRGLSPWKRNIEVRSIYIPFWHQVAIPSPRRLSILHQEVMMMRFPLNENRPYTQISRKQELPWSQTRRTQGVEVGISTS